MDGHTSAPGSRQVPGILYWGSARRRRRYPTWSARVFAEAIVRPWVPTDGSPALATRRAYSIRRSLATVGVPTGQAVPSRHPAWHPQPKHDSPVRCLSSTYAHNHAATLTPESFHRQKDNVAAWLFEIHTRGTSDKHSPPCAPRRIQSHS